MSNEINSQVHGNFGNSKQTSETVYVTKPRDTARNLTGL